MSTPPREIVTAVFATGLFASFTTVPKRPVEEAFAGAVPKAKIATIRSERRRPQVFMAKAYGQAMTLLGKDFQNSGFWACCLEKPKTPGT
jgi:ABC-type enterobactin transport system permease subunit